MTLMKNLGTFCLNRRFYDAFSTTPFHLAAAGGHTDLIIMLCSKVKNPNARDSRGRTPLHAAASQGGSRAAAVQLLLQKGAHVSAADRKGFSPVHCATDRDCLKFLLDHTEDASCVNAQADDGLTPLMLAAAAGRTDCVSELLDHGADPIKICDHNGFTPLHYAAFSGQTQVVDRLLKAGADPKAASSRGWTAIHVAVASGQIATLTLLIENVEDFSAHALARDKQG